MASESLTLEPSIDTDKLSYEIFSILESKFLFGYDDQKLWIPKEISSQVVLDDDDNGGGGGVSLIKNQRGKICILSIDGGEMRGVLPGKSLDYLEQALKKKSGDPDARISDYFDVAAGTGTGGIFTAMLFATKGDDNDNRPIFKAEETWKFLVEQGKLFLRGSSNSGGSFLWRFCSSGSEMNGGLERVMKESFSEKGRCLTLKDTLKPVLIPCYDLSSSAPFLFSRADALEKESFDFRLWEICVATTAKPSVFDPVELLSVDGQTRCVAVDGGLTMSNPTAAAITHVLHNKQEFPFVRGVEDLMVLSLGSGQLLENSSYDHEQVKGWKAKEWARPMAGIAADGAADLVDQAVAMAFGQSRSSNYVRIQANGSTSYRFGVNVDSDPSPKNVSMLVGAADEMLKQKNIESVLFGGKRIGEQTNSEKLDWFAGELVLEHQRRGCRIAPTVAFKQAVPKRT